ncbi:MAG TPA: haloacid dehalogenase type II [Casimicrobiaceae bacterium]|nr:haloacid dehalogenase type II [Casimicrobiaceae bacterium]
MSSPSSRSIQAFVFDAYGTLFDVHSVITLAETLAAGHGSALSRLWRTKQLEYTWLSSLMNPDGEARDDFAALTARALDYALASLGIDLGAGAHAQLCDAYLALSPFPDAAAALSGLAPRPRWILSNGTLAMLEPLVRRSGLGAHLDGVLSVDAAGIFKPSPRVYQLAVDALRLPPSQIGFVSSNCWDAIGARSFGFTTFWINRLGAPADRHGTPPDLIIDTLADLPSVAV